MPQLYDHIGIAYANTRRPDARIAAQLRSFLPPTATVLNVGAGTGSYEPTRHGVVAVEPSQQMIRQRNAAHAPVVQALAEHLPFADNAFDVVMGVLTLHHWRDVTRGIAECARVARHRVLFLTWDPASHGFWLVNEYFPGIAARDNSSFPSMELLQHCLGPLHIEQVPIHADCQDGFLGAYWRRPEAYLNAQVRAGMSAFAKETDIAIPLARLSHDIASGNWGRRFGGLLSLESLDLGYRLVVADIHPQIATTRKAQ